MERTDKPTPGAMRALLNWLEERCQDDALLTVTAPNEEAYCIHGDDIRAAADAETRAGALAEALRRAMMKDGQHARGCNAIRYPDRPCSPHCTHIRSVLRGFEA